MRKLSAFERKHLRSLAHHLEPAIIVGKSGVTDHLVNAVNDALDAHELIKVRFNEFKEEKEQLAAEIEARTHSSACGLIGHVLILYREHENPEKRRIVFPCCEGNV